VKILMIAMLGIVLLSGCAKKAGMTTSKIVLMSGNTTMGSALNNGFIFYGKNSDGKTFLRKVD